GRVSASPRLLVEFPRDASTLLATRHDAEHVRRVRPQGDVALLAEGELHRLGCGRVCHSPKPPSGRPRAVAVTRRPSWRDGRTTRARRHPRGMRAPAAPRAPRGAPLRWL